MNIELTRDADRVICTIYKLYLEKVDRGLAKTDAKRFNREWFLEDTKLSQWNQRDLDATILELGRKGLIKIWIDGSFLITDSGII